MNMKRVALLFAGLMLFTTVATSTSVFAQFSTSQGQLKPHDTDLYRKLSLDCLPVKFKLSHVHENDGLSYVTLNQEYESVANKLMKTFNNRMTRNKLGSSELITQAADFETALATFHSDYRAYEVAMSNLIKGDCHGQTQSFYLSVQETRQLRNTVDADIKQLNAAMDQYYATFTNFSKSVLKPVEKKETNESN